MSALKEIGDLIVPFGLAAVCIGGAFGAFSKKHSNDVVSGDLPLSERPQRSKLNRRALPKMQSRPE